jgi:hypothetical protein
MIFHLSISLLTKFSSCIFIFFEYNGYKMIHCKNCANTLELRRLACKSCGLHYEGRFQAPRLARLAPEHQGLVEEILLSGANLKQVALQEGVSYPTLRKRLEAAMDALARLREADAQESARLLDQVERGEIEAEEAARLMEEMSGDPR